MSVETWPFLPNSQLIDVCEWRTDIIKTQTTEQRICTREMPRRSFVVTSVLTHWQVEIARAIARRATSWLVPDWIGMYRMDAAVTGAPCTLPDGKAMLIAANADYEVVDVASGALGTVSGDWRDVRIVPLVAGRVTGAFEFSKRPGGYASCVANFEMVAPRTVQYDDSLYPKYQGLSVVTDCNRVGSGTSSDGILWPENVIDNALGRPAVIRTRQYANVAFSQRWHEFESDRIAAVRAWAFSRRGSWLPFWLPGGGDLRVTASAGLTLEVAHHTPGETLVWLRAGEAGVVRRIAAASKIASGWSLTLDGTTAIGKITDASYLRKVRFDADRLELQYAAGAGMSLEVPCVEVKE